MCYLRLDQRSDMYTFISPFRLYPTAAQLAARLTLEDDHIGGYFIPKGV